MTPQDFLTSVDGSVAPVIMPRVAEDSQTGISAAQTTGAGCPPCSRPNLNGEEMFGIGFGAGMVVASLILVGVYVFVWRRRTKTNFRNAMNNGDHDVSEATRRQSIDHGDPRVSETNGQQLMDQVRRNVTEATGHRFIPLAIEERGSRHTINMLDALPEIITHDIWRRDFSSLGYAIDNFVFNRVHRDPVPEAEFNESKLVDLASKATYGREWAPTLAHIDSRSRSAECFIAQAILRCMDPGCDPSLSLLPPSIISSYAQILAVETNRDQPCK